MTKWTPWTLGAREDGAGDVFEWLSCMIVCDLHHAHGHMVYCPVSFLADSVPEDVELQRKVLDKEMELVVVEMEQHGCDHMIPPIPLFA